MTKLKNTKTKGKNAKTHVDHVMSTLLQVPAVTPLKLYRFVCYLEDGGGSFTLAIIPAKNDNEAFHIGCALMPAGAPELAEDYNRRHLLEDDEWGAAPDEAHFSVIELEDEGELMDAAGDMWNDYEDLVGRYGQDPRDEDA